jgi:Co/Zn/Cd efflux system component
VVNLAATWAISKANRTLLNVEGAYQHILTDLFGFIATAVAGAVVAVPVGRRTRYELSDPRLGHALEDLRTAVVAVETDRTCPDAGMLRMTVISLGLTPARRVRLLVAATITYNVIEAAVAITAGTLASSTALVGFGLDSVIEVSSAAAVAWQFSAREHAVREAREKTTLRIIALSFFALAAYVTVDAVRALAGTGEAARSIPGIVLAALSLLVMPFLSAAQRRAGRELGSASAVADSQQTLLCTYLSAVLLVGLVANATLGWSWADPIAALAIAAIAVREGRDAWHGKGCCAPPATVAPAGAVRRKRPPGAGQELHSVSLSLPAPAPAEPEGPACGRAHPLRRPQAGAGAPEPGWSLPLRRGHRRLAPPLILQPHLQHLSLGGCPVSGGVK